MSGDPYKVLGVDPDATDDEIRRAHRQLVKKLHPDAGSGSSASEFRDVQDAYDTLIDRDKREAYDRSRDLRGARAGHWGAVWRRSGPVPSGYHLDLRNLYARSRAEPLAGYRRREVSNAGSDDPFDLFRRHFDVWLSDDWW